MNIVRNIIHRIRNRIYGIPKYKLIISWLFDLAGLSCIWMGEYAVGGCLIAMGILYDIRLYRR